MRNYCHFIVFAGALWSISCSHTSNNSEWFNCNTIIDTTEIVEDWMRGAFVINDSLAITPGCHPFDKGFCETIDLRIEPIISYHGKHICTLGDLYPPFKIYKPNVSDTLTVIKNGKVIFFRIPAYLCEENYE